MNINQVAVVLFTVKEYCQTAEALRTTLKKIREIGYQAVQVSGGGPISPERINELIEEAGLVCCATHEACDLIREKPEEVVKKLDVLGCQYTAYPFPACVDLTNKEELGSLIHDLNEAGRVLREAGKTLCYHNHGNEFYRQNGQTILELIYQETDAQNLHAELDTFWVQAGGADPIHWIQRMTGRLPLLHLKDYAIDANAERYFAEIGSGNLNWPGIISAAEEAGCNWFIVEQDVCPGDPFEAIEKSFRFIRDHLCTPENN